MPALKHALDTPAPHAFTNVSTATLKGRQTACDARPRLDQLLHHPAKDPVLLALLAVCNLTGNLPDLCRHLYGPSLVPASCCISR